MNREPWTFHKGEMTEAEKDCDISAYGRAFSVSVSHACQVPPIIIDVFVV